MPEMEWRSIGVLGSGSGQKWIEENRRNAEGSAGALNPTREARCLPGAEAARLVGRRFAG